MFNRPIVLFLFLWMAGIILSHNFLPPPLPFLIITSLFLLPFLFIRHPLAKTFSIFALFPLSVAWNSAYFSQFKAPPPCEGRGFVSGMVLEETSFTEDGRASFLLRGEKIKAEGREDEGKNLRVFLSEGERVNLKLGQNVELSGDIIASPLKTRLGGISYYVRSAKVIKVEEGRGFVALIGRLRFRLQETSKRLLPLESSLILTNLVIGKADFPAPSEIVEAFRKTGTIHILVVSGTQVSLLVAFIWFLLKAMKIRGRGSSLGILFVPREIRKEMGLRFKDDVLILLRGVFFFLFFSLVIVGYTYLVGSEPPIRRAAVMGILGTAGVILTREMDTFNIFALTALLLLISYPPALFSISFQLSFLAVWGLIAVLPMVRGLLPPPRSAFLRSFYIPFVTSISAQLAVSPLLIYHFKMLSPIAIIANVFAVPLSFVILIEGLCLLPIASLFPILGKVISPLLGFPIFLLLYIVDFFSRIPLASLQISLPPFIVYYYLFLLFLVGEVSATPSSHFMRKSFIFCFSLFPLLLIWHNVF